MIELDLPIPPTTNNLFVNAGKRRFISPVYEAWRKEAWISLPKALPKMISGPFRFRLLLPSNMRGDVDNRIKAAMDFCVSWALCMDDRHAVAVSAEKSADVAEGRCRIQIEGV